MNREEILKKSRRGNSNSEEWEGHLWLRGLNFSHYVMLAMWLLTMILTKDLRINAAVTMVVWTTITANYTYQFFKDRRIGTLIPFLLSLLILVFWNLPDFIPLVAG